MEKVTVRFMRQPTGDSIERDLEWFCESFGLLGPRDKGKTCLRLFRSVIDAARKEAEVSIEELSRKADISRTSVVHHLSILEDSGLVVREGGGFALRMRSLQKVVDEIGVDLERTLKSIREIAEDIDRDMGLLVRKRQD